VIRSLQSSGITCIYGSKPVTTDHPAFKEAETEVRGAAWQKLMSINGTCTSDDSMWAFWAT
jgi:hypothetical protein